MIKIKVEGIKALSTKAIKIKDLKHKLKDEVKNICNRFGNQIVRTSVKDYLNGPRPGKLGVKTGQLRSSIRFNLTEIFNSFVVSVGTDVPYARIHEEGGMTAPHIILPKKKKVLAWPGPSGMIFAKKVNHPGSNIKARPFLRPSFEKHLPELKTNLRNILSRVYKKG